MALVKPTGSVEAVPTVDRARPPRDHGVVTVRWLARGVQDVPAATGWLSPEESARLAALRFPKRRTEIRLARWTAKLAIAHTLDLGDDPGSLATIEIRPATTGAPLAFVGGEPAPVAVSMTDRADWAVCAVAPADRPLGCDLELVEPRTEAFVRDWLTPAEQELVRGAPAGQPRDLLANLVWSAKESALKVLQTGLRRPTRSVEVDVADRAGDERWARLTVRTVEGAALPGWWRRYGAFLLTLICDPELGPPVPLEDPPRLAGASPSHSWMGSP